MTKFVINGSGEEAKALLKASLDAQNDHFKASLSAMFKTAAPPAAPKAPTAKSDSTWSLNTNRNTRFTR